jgi:outer membrane protein
MKRYLLPLVITALLGTSAAHGENLSQVYELALKNDLQLRIAKANRDSTLEAKPQAEALSLPFVSLSGSAGGVRRDINASPSGSDLDTFATADLSLSLIQSVYRRENRILETQADMQIAQAEVQLAAEEQDLILRVAQSYFDVLSAQDNLTFVKAENAAIARQLEQAKQRFEVGLIAITAVHESQAAFDQSRADLIRAENTLDNAWEALHEITLVQVSSLSQVIVELPLTPPMPQDLEQWAETAQQQNLAVEAARYGVDIAREEIELQDAGDDPTLDLVGSHTLSASSSAAGTDSQTTVVSLELNIPLYTGGAVQSRTRQAQDDYVASQETLDRERRSANRAVRDAYRAVLASISGVEALLASTVSAESSLEAIEAGFDVGTRTQVDVLDAQRDLFRARSNYATVRYGYIVAGLQLKQAAGTLAPQDMEQVNSLLQ